MKNAAFTICAKNYIGLAKVLDDSIKKINLNLDFFIFVADETENVNLKYDKNILIAKNVLKINNDKWENMSFKYDITEFCTSIKPLCFQHIFHELEYDKCIYFDPDIVVFNSINDIYQLLNEHSIILTPHFNTIETNYTGNWAEKKFLYSGIYNLGFLALKRDLNSEKMLDWWKTRLEILCFQNITENLFTDQKWMDFIPALFPDSVLVSKDLGYNVAPWNFHEREIISLNNEFYVKNRITKDEELFKLKFVHFSGFKYKELFKGNVTHTKNINFDLYPDFDILYKKYIQTLNESSLMKYIDLEYSYSSFDNGMFISTIHRRLYRRLSEDGRNLNDLFSQNGDYYKLLKKSKLISTQLRVSDKVGIGNIENVSKKIRLINYLFLFMYKIFGAKLYFIIARTLRLYSIIENHVFIIDKNYIKKPNLRN